MTVIETIHNPQFVRYITEVPRVEVKVPQVEAAVVVLPPSADDLAVRRTLTGR